MNEADSLLGGVAWEALPVGMVTCILGAVLPSYFSLLVTTGTRSYPPAEWTGWEDLISIDVFNIGGRPMVSKNQALVISWGINDLVPGRKQVEKRKTAAPAPKNTGYHPQEVLLMPPPPSKLSASFILILLNWLSNDQDIEMSNVLAGYWDLQNESIIIWYVLSAKICKTLILTLQLGHGASSNQPNKRARLMDMLLCF